MKRSDAVRRKAIGYVRSVVAGVVDAIGVGIEPVANDRGRRLGRWSGENSGGDESPVAASPGGRVGAKRAGREQAGGEGTGSDNRDNPSTSSVDSRRTHNVRFPFLLVLSACTVPPAHRSTPDVDEYPTQARGECHSQRRQL